MNFVYGFCIGPSGKYERFAQPSLQKHAPDAVVLERRDQTSILEAYNEIIDEYLSQKDPTAALVLMHEDVEILSSVESQLAALFADPDVAIVGVIGGRGVRSVRWYRSRSRHGRVEDTFNGVNDFGGGPSDVDIADGLFLALSPWATKNLRFDTGTYSGFHAYDADICMQARAHGKRVVVLELPLIHHTKGGFGNASNHRRSDDAFRAKWGIRRDPIWYRAAKALRRRVY
jgi:hypothetical protein